MIASKLSPTPTKEKSKETTQLTDKQAQHLKELVAFYELHVFSERAK